MKYSVFFAIFSFNMFVYVAVLVHLPFYTVMYNSITAIHCAVVVEMNEDHSKEKNRLFIQRLL